MHVRLLDDRDEKTYAVIFDPGDEPMKGLLDVARREGLTASQLTAVGGFRRATLGYFDPQQKEYQRIPVDEQVEVLSLIGDVSEADQGPQVHAHVVVGRRDGTTRGGHLLDAEVWPTLEVIVTESPSHLRRRFNPAVGIALIDLR
jgi:predicted DNA-binding protein with PD1-like motif